MTEPTDAELWQLHMQMPGVHKNPIDFARAVLAKWATPPAVAGEPVGYCHEIKWRAHQSEQVQKITRKTQPEYGYTQALYTTPQPTQAQAGAVPLNHKNIEPVCRFLADRGIYLSDETTKALITVAHGIKGGQHG